MEKIIPPLCPCCGLPLQTSPHCPNCARFPLRITSINAPFVFEGTIRRVVHELKYRQIRTLATPLAALLYDYLQNYPLPADTIIPVPLHSKRLRERGYNQSALIAKCLGKLAKLPVSTKSLVRTRHTSPQVGTATAAERRRNITGAFAPADSSLSGKNILLIDDVATTGATLDACAAAAYTGGAAAVWGLVVARDIPKSNVS